jgi:hypothetical protein
LSYPLEPLLVPVDEGARVIGVGISTLWAMIRAEQVETVTLNRRRLVVVASLRRLVEERRAAPKEPLASPPLGRGRQPKRQPEPTVTPN